MSKAVKNSNNKKVDLSKLPITQLDGTIVEHDFSKELAQAIFANTQSISEHAFSLDLFKNPIVELTDENKAIVKEYTEKYFKAFVQVAINELIGGVAKTEVLTQNTINMNLTELIATTVGIIGSIGGVGTLIYWRQNKLGSTSDALSKAFDALEKVTNLVDDQQEKHNKQMSQKDVVIEQLYEVIDQKTQVAMDNQTKIDKLTREWKERDYEFATMKRQIKTMQNIINDFETRAKHAESNFCSVTECELRVPALGTYKPK